MVSEFSGIDGDLEELEVVTRAVGEFPAGGVYQVQGRHADVAGSQGGKSTCMFKVDI